MGTGMNEEHEPTVDIKSREKGWNTERFICPGGKGITA